MCACFKFLHHYFIEFVNHTCFLGFLGGCLAAALRGVRFWGDAAKELTQELGREPTMEELLKRANFRHDSARGEVILWRVWWWWWL
jgi:hypothetical protein